MGAVTNISEEVRTGKRSALEVVSCYLRRIDALDPSLHAFLHVSHEQAKARAGEIDNARAQGHMPGPLAGVPIAVKDNICTTGAPTTCASRSLEGFVSRYNAHVIDRLEQAGAIVVGKTNLDEFAMGGSNEHSAYGPTLNPWDHTRVPGGSSGGSAVAVAARMVPAALGSDTGGSVRQPASFCGVLGLKPTYGRVSRYGLVAFGSSLDQIGVLTTDAEDAALMLSVISGHDPRDSTSIVKRVPSVEIQGPSDMSGVRIGVCRAHWSTGIGSAVQQKVEQALDTWQRLGAHIIEIDLPHLEYAVSTYYLIASAEASSNLSRFDSVHYGVRAEGASDIHALYRNSRGQGLGDEVKRRIMLGTFALSAGYYDAYYDKASRVRTLIKQDFEKAFDHVDLIASPSSPTTAFELGDKQSDPLAMYLMDVFTIPANLTGHGAISIPCGMDDGGLPVGIQLTAPAFDEASLLVAAKLLQEQTDYHQLVPPCTAEYSKDA